MENDLVKPESRQEFEGQLHFSYSQLSTFLICPMKYAHQYVWGTPWEIKPIALPFGKAVQRAAELYYLCLKDTGEIIPLGQMIDTFVAAYDGGIKQTEVEISMKEDETIAGLREQGIELLKLFYRETNPQTITAVEFPFFRPARGADASTDPGRICRSTAHSCPRQIVAARDPG